MSDVSSVVNFFATANEGFTTTLSSTISAGASTVPLNDTAGLTDGTIFVGIIEPGATAEQVFTGTVNLGSAQINNVVWTRGTNVGHASGATIVDYVTGTDHNMMSAGILKSHNQDGTPKSGITYPTSTFTSPTLNTPTVNNPSFSGTPTGSLSNVVTTIPYKFSVYKNSGQTINASTTAKVTFDTELFDTNSNFDSVTNNRFIAPINGFYYFNTAVQIAFGGTDNYYVEFAKNGGAIKRLAEISTGANSGVVAIGGSGLLQLSANDYVEVFVTNAGGTNRALTTGSASTYFEGYLLSAT